MLFSREICPFSKVHPGVILAKPGIPIYVVNSRLDHPIKSGNDGLPTFSDSFFLIIFVKTYVIKL